MIIGCLFLLVGSRMPFKKILPNAVVLSVFFWLALRLGGQILSHENYARYVTDSAETIQGFVLAVVLGCILGAFWKTENNENG